MRRASSSHPPVVAVGAAVLVTCILIVSVPSFIAALLQFLHLEGELTARTREISSIVLHDSSESIRNLEGPILDVILLSTANHMFNTFERQLATIIDYARFTRALIENDRLNLRVPEDFATAVAKHVRHYFHTISSGFGFAMEVGFSDPFIDHSPNLVEVHISGAASLEPLLPYAVTWRPKNPDGSDGPLPDDLVAVFLRAQDFEPLKPAMSRAYPGYTHPPELTQTVNQTRWNYWLSREETDQYLENSSCMWAAGPWYMSEDQTCTGKAIAPTDWACSGRRFRNSNLSCVSHLSLARDTVAYSTIVYGPLLAMQLKMRLQDPLVTTAAVDYNSSATHGKGLGLGAQPGGNAFGSCSSSTPCTLPPPVNSSLATPIFDDHLGYINAVLPLNELSSVLAQHAARQTEILRARAPAYLLALLDLSVSESEGGVGVRVFALDHNGLLLATSVGSPVSTTQGRLQLDELPGDTVVKPLCVAMANHTAIAYAEADGDEGNVRFSSRCGLPRLHPSANAEEVEFAESFTFTFRYGDPVVTWISTATLKAFPDALMRDTNALEFAWIVVAMPLFYVSHEADALFENLANTQLAQLDEFTSTVDHLRRLIVVALCVSVGVAAAGALIAAIVMFSALMRRVSAAVDVISCLAELDDERLLSIMTSTGVSLSASLKRKLAVMDTATTTAAPYSPTSASIFDSSADAVHAASSPSVVVGVGAAPTAAGGVVGGSVSPAIPLTPPGWMLSNPSSSHTGSKSGGPSGGNAKQNHSEMGAVAGDVHEEILSLCATWMGNTLTSSVIKEVSLLMNGTATVVRTLISLGKYVPHEVAVRYAGSDECAKLGMEEVPSAVLLLIDIAGFTTFCESSQLSSVMYVMTDYFATMTDCVGVTGGEVDTFVGDAVLASWNAVAQHPAPATAALSTAVNMIGVVRRKNAAWSGLKCRVGIASGSVMVGNFGSGKRFQHGAVGRLVGKVERMESLNTHFHSSVLLPSSLVEAWDGGDGEAVATLFPLRYVGLLPRGNDFHTRPSKEAAGGGSKVRPQSAGAGTAEEVAVGGGSTVISVGSKSGQLGSFSAANADVPDEDAEGAFELFLADALFSRVKKAGWLERDALKSDEKDEGLAGLTVDVNDNGPSGSLTRPKGSARFHPRASVVTLSSKVVPSLGDGTEGVVVGGRGRRPPSRPLPLGACVSAPAVEGGGGVDETSVDDSEDGMQRLPTTAAFASGAVDARRGLRRRELSEVGGETDVATVQEFANGVLPPRGSRGSRAGAVSEEGGVRKRRPRKRRMSIGTALTYRTGVSAIPQRKYNMDSAARFKELMSADTPLTTSLMLLLTDRESAVLRAANAGMQAFAAKDWDVARHCAERVISEIEAEEFPEDAANAASVREAVAEAALARVAQQYEKMKSVCEDILAGRALDGQSWELF